MQKLRDLIARLKFSGGITTLDSIVKNLNNQEVFALVTKAVTHFKVKIHFCFILALHVELSPPLLPKCPLYFLTVVLTQVHNFDATFPTIRLLPAA